MFSGFYYPRNLLIIKSKKIANYLGVDCHYLITGVKDSNLTLANELGLTDESITLLKDLQSTQAGIVTEWVKKELNRSAHDITMFYENGYNEADGSDL